LATICNQTEFSGFSETSFIVLQARAAANTPPVIGARNAPLRLVRGQGRKHFDHHMVERSGAVDGGVSGLMATQDALGSIKATINPGRRFVHNPQQGRRIASGTLLDVGRGRVLDHG
jgi:hypothetical protein